MWGVLIRAVAFVAVLLVAGCGGAGSGGEGDPATVVPADARFYIEVVARPEGALREDALDAAGKVLDSADPEARIREFVEHSTAPWGKVDYDSDIAPWLGERAGMWTQPPDEEVLVLLAATDTDQAWQSLQAMLDRGGYEATERSYGDNRYLVSRYGMTAGIVDEFVAIGTEAMYKRAVDAAEGDSLADADEYADAVDALPDEQLAVFWVDTPALLETAAQKDPQLGQLRSLTSGAEPPPVAGAFMANGDRLELELQAGDRLPFESTPLLQELPGDSWAAFGAADVGTTLRATINRLGGALGGVAIRGQLRSETGLDLDRDLLDWIGHTGVFMRGTPATADGGVVIQVTNEERAADAFGRLVGAIQVGAGGEAEPVEIAGAEQAFAIDDVSMPKPIVLARGSERMVATIGVPAAEAALGTDDGLGETDLYAEAQELVGTEPSFLVSVPQLLELVGDHPGAAAMRRHLEAYTVLAGGVAENTARFAAGLR